MNSKWLNAAVLFLTILYNIETIKKIFFLSYYPMPNVLFESKIRFWFLKRKVLIQNSNYEYRFSLKLSCRAFPIACSDF